MITDPSQSEQDPTQLPNLLSRNQRVVVLAMGVTLFVLAVATILILVFAGRSPVGGLDSPVVLSTTTGTPADVPTSTPTATPALPIYVPDAVPTPESLYWPPEPQPLASPNAPSDLLWWDAQYLYRRPILLDVVAAESPAGTWAKVLFSGQGELLEGRTLETGHDLRVVVWDGNRWWEIPRITKPDSGSARTLLFHIQDRQIARQGGYFVYFGNVFAGPPPIAENAPESSRLLLTLGERESVEWGSNVVWSANNPNIQTIVSPDGRIVIECPPMGLQTDVQVRLRTVPLQESSRNRPLPEYELHVEPPPEPLGWSNIVRWSPPLRVAINWAGLPADVQALRDRAHFEYDVDNGTWYSIPVQFDERRGLLSYTTEQP